MAETPRGCFTRRGTLVALAAVASAPALPALAGTIRPRALPEGLAAVARAAAGTPVPQRIGAIAAGTRSVSEVADALLSRLGPPPRDGDWRAALVAAGRRDIARSETVEILGRTVMRTEADLLALGTLLRGQTELA